MYDEDESDNDLIASTPANALAYLQSIYCNPAEPEGRRLRAAVAALPFESPKLSATAIVNGETFAAMLDRAIRTQRHGARG